MTPQEQAINLLSKMCVNNCTKKNINRMIGASITAIDLLSVVLGSNFIFNL